MHRAAGRAGFADALVVGGGSGRLERIEAVVDWGRIEALLAGVHASGTGRPSFRPLTLLKVLLLEGWYGLSDPAMEEALGDRLSFRRFCGLALDEAVPDHSTISRFRSLLVRHDLTERVFDEVVRQLDMQGLVVKAGTLVDATLVASAAAERRGPLDGRSGGDMAEARQRQGMVRLQAAPGRGPPQPDRAQGGADARQRRRGRAWP